MKTDKNSPRKSGLKKPVIVFKKTCWKWRKGHDLKNMEQFRLKVIRMTWRSQHYANERHQRIPEWPCLHCDSGSLPFTAAVRGADRTGHWRGIQVACELRVRNTHLQRQVFTQLEAVVAGGGGGRQKRTKERPVSFWESVFFKRPLREVLWE